MSVFRYTCKSCGLVTRVEDGQEYRACVCHLPDYDVVDESAPVEEAPP